MCCSFIAYPVFSILAAVSVWCYKIDTDVTCRQMCAHVGSLLCRLDVNSFLICVQLFGMFTGVIETFLFWHLKELCAPQVNVKIICVSLCKLYLHKSIASSANLVLLMSQYIGFKIGYLDMQRHI